MSEREFILPETIYHYTDIAGAIAILQHGTIRATHLRFMNDRKELAFEADIFDFLSGLEAQPGEGLTDEHGWLEVMSKAWTAELHDDILWVSCFSHLEDDLGLWGRYGDRGVCIGFDSAALLRALSPTLASEVFYIDGTFSDHPKASVEIERMARAQRLAGRFDEPELSGLGALAKQHHWSAEGEIRFVWHTHAHDSLATQDGGPFRRMFLAASKYGARPHMDMPFGRQVPAIDHLAESSGDDQKAGHVEDVTVWETGLVRSIRIGPSPFQDETERAFTLMTKQIESLAWFVGLRPGGGQEVELSKSRIEMR